MLANILYRTPKSQFSKIQRFGGYSGYKRMLSGSKRMEKAAFALPVVQSFPEGLPLYFLTGKRYLHQTLFCIQSLNLTSPAKFRFVLVDDGSFNKSIIAAIKRQVTDVSVITHADVERNLKEVLPEKTYPLLHHKRKIYPHIRKLTDIHTLPDGAWKLVLDSDMLFWRDPKEITDWLIKPETPLYMKDCTQSYGYSKDLMEHLTGTKIKPLVNVGAIGLNSGDIDWNKLENWVGELEQKEGTSYYLEQALTAMIIGNRFSICLDAEAYIVNPGIGRKGTLHHYVDLSKKEYLTDLWTQFTH